MISTNEIDTILSSGGDVVDQDGKKIGSIGQVYLDDQSGQPAWITVNTGLFGTGESFAPLVDATVRGDDVHVAYGKGMVKDAPHSDDSDGHLSPDQEADLYRYYSLESARVDQPLFDQDADTNAVDLDAGTTGTAADTVTGTGAGHDTSGPDTDDAMTRSEERLHVGTETTEAGRARLRKYVVAEQVTETVPVSHDEIRVTREAITDANVGDALSGGDLTEETHEVVLTADRVVTDKETVPVERVQLGTETVTEQQKVTEEVRHEEIELDGDDTVTDGRRSDDRTTGA
ncbi:DUF2382 domain-containing protein [Frigoribacterium sp. RIT-PI-h]|uniref:DUF2382 domain-containing protein n=1 Tax=Frigoribacterium sp. RIT-PI-h TaxID=1690245 RepID=UPI0006B89EA3|nr:PRC and DUF2382 domain-containing protein [Frigoribacterium sp. RIT-PI-h]KPG82320.1 photosystem reaction center subunit H [Frigoribacterium sp. RIT-PI-h]